MRYVGKKVKFWLNGMQIDAHAFISIDPVSL